MKISTQSGQLIDILFPNPKQINIEDIAHSLSHQCRFNGHTSRFYSVAEHSLLAVELALHLEPDDNDLALSMLLHDAHEAYTGDIIRPLKTDIHTVAEETLDAVIGDKFGVSLTDDRIKLIDDMMLDVERVKLIGLSEEWPAELGSLIAVPDTIQNSVEVCKFMDVKQSFIRTFEGIKNCLDEQNT